jgi:ATP-dependent DNA helicase PIF1
MNEKQKCIVDSVSNGKNVLITGGAGSGKSYLVKYISETIGKNIGITAMTGCAALLINGMTLHSFLGIGLAKEDPLYLFKRIQQKYGLLEDLESLEVLLIDEVSMLNDVLFDKISELFKIIHSTDKPFGNLQLIFVGDMSQIKPVEGKYCFLSKVWKLCKFEVHVLIENMRVNSDTRFESFLKDIRWGKITDFELIEEMKSNTFSGDILPTRLFSTNKDVDEINTCELELLLSLGNKSETYKIIYSKDPVKLKKTKKYINDNKIQDPLICTGAQVMITRNISKTIVNGTRGIVLELNKNNIVLKLLNNQIYRLDYLHVSDQDIDFKYMPIRLSWAISIHKSQGATIDLLEIDLGESIFTHGQAYVALSRARTSKSIRITKFDPGCVKTSKSVISFYKKYLL